MGFQTLKQKMKLTLGSLVQDDSGPSGREGRKISDVVSYRSLNDIPSTTRAMVIQVGCCTQRLHCCRPAAGHKGWASSSAQSHHTCRRWSAPQSHSMQQVYPVGDIRLAGSNRWLAPHCSLTVTLSPTWATDIMQAACVGALWQVVDVLLCTS